MAATMTADSDSDYGWDLSLEDEQILGTLASTTSIVPPAAVPAAQPKAAPPLSTLSRRLSTSTTTTTTTTATSYGLGSGFSSDSESTIRFLLDAASTVIDEDALLAAEQQKQAQASDRSTPAASRSPQTRSPHSRYVARHPSAGNVSRDVKGKSPLNDTSRVNAGYTFITRSGPHSVPLPAPVAIDVAYPDLTDALSTITQDTAHPDPPPIPETLQPDPPRQAKTSSQDNLAPLVRFRTFPRKPLSVTDITAGAWCELQQEYTLKYLPGGKKTRTAAMKGGIKLHQKLEDEVHTTVKVDVLTKEDAFGLKLWNVVQGLRTLRQTGLTRELEVWGVVEGEVVNGVIDVLTYICPDQEMEEEVRSSQGSKQSSQEQDPAQPKITAFMDVPGPMPEPEGPLVYIADVKTRGSRTLPSGVAMRPSKIQLFLYHRMLSEMAAHNLDFHRVLRRYGLNPDLEFSDTFIAQIGSLHDEIFFDAETESQGPSTTAEMSDIASQGSEPELVRYGTLRKLLDLFDAELGLTFPNGAASIGSLLSVQYHLRRSGPESDEEENANTRIGINTMAMDDAVLDRHIVQNMKWWRGERAADGVPIEEAPLKCSWCEFAERCEWRQKLDAEWLERARTKLATKGSGIQVDTQRRRDVKSKRRRSGDSTVSG